MKYIPKHEKSIKKKISLLSLLMAAVVLLCSVPNIIWLTQAAGYELPIYYIDTGTKDAAGNIVYRYESVVGSSGILENVYRVLDTNEFYDCTDAGVKITGRPLTLEDQLAERPQPSHAQTSPYTNRVNVVGTATTNDTADDGYVLLQYDFVGKYRYNFAATANIYGGNTTNQMLGFLRDEHPTVPIPTVVDMRFCNGPAYSGRSGVTGNGAYANLTAPQKSDKSGSLDKSNIKYAFLVMETSFDVVTGTPASGSADYGFGATTSLSHYQNMANRPMTLVGPNGGTMLSNGYLPEGFKVVFGTHSSLSSDKSSILSFNLNGTRRRAVTITDVTDFVRTQGYGRYYGYNIPTRHRTSIADVGCGWQLIVVEEDSTMERTRVGSLQLGAVYNKAGSDLTLTVPFGGYKTPSEGDFGGQIFFSSFASNPGGAQCLVHLDPDGNTGSAAEITLSTTDKSGGGINRKGSSAPYDKSFGQNIITLNGQRRTDISSYRMCADPPTHIVGEYGTNVRRTDGMDVELLEVSNNLPSEGEHNAKFVHSAENIRLRIPPSTDGTNVITGIGVIVDVEMPTFESGIAHTDIQTGNTGQNVYAGNTVRFNATVTNVTGTDSQTPGLTDTQVKLKLDPALTVNPATLASKLSITYYDFDELYNEGTSDYDPVKKAVKRTEFTEVGSLAELLTNGLHQYYFDAATNTLTINFGIDFTAETAEGDIEKKLYNNRGDYMEISLETVSSTNPKRELRNTVSVTGQDAVGENGMLFPLASLTYTTSNDVFDTYRYPTIHKDAYINASLDSEYGTTAGSPVTVQRGNTITYKITLTNDLMLPFSGIVVSDIIPAGLDVNEPLPEGATAVSHMSGGTLVTWPAVTIPAKTDSGDPPEILEFVVSATVMSGGRTLNNTASYAMTYSGNPVNMNSNTTYHIVPITVTFDLNNIDAPAVQTPDNQTIESGTLAQKPNPNPEWDDNHIFAGWYTDPECTVEWHFDTPVIKDMTLYAKWDSPGGDTYHFLFYKVDGFNYSKKLEGAEFEIYELICMEGHTAEQHNTAGTESLCWSQNPFRTAVSEGNGTELGRVDFGELEPGIYMLVEAQAPGGYNRPEGQWQITVSQADEDEELVIDIRGVKGAGDKLPPAFVSPNTAENPTGNYLLPNHFVFNLPISGGTGTLIFTVLGGLFMASAGIFFVILLIKKKKR